MKLRATLNGRAWEAEIDGSALLLDVLRDAGLTGTKEGCRIGVCGLCSVVVDGRPVSACIYPAACADGARVTTVEGIAEQRPDLVDSFVACEGMQCGICTPGQVVMASTMGPEVSTPDDVRHYLSGNLCRCTGYQTIVEAALAQREPPRG